MTIKLRWAFKKLREWLKQNCLDIETVRLGDMKYCLKKYSEVTGRKIRGGRSSLALFKEYNDCTSPIFKGVKVKGVTLRKKKKKEFKSDYEKYIKSAKWRAFKRKVIEERGELCERCRTKPDVLDLHHKTYARLFNELPQDVLLLCRGCHQDEHERIFDKQFK